jgi:hypothetical protein
MPAEIEPYLERSYGQHNMTRQESIDRIQSRHFLDQVPQTKMTKKHSEDFQGVSSIPVKAHMTIAARESSVEHLTQRVIGQAQRPDSKHEQRLQSGLTRASNAEAENRDRSSVSSNKLLRGIESSARMPSNTRYVVHDGINKSLKELGKSLEKIQSAERNSSHSLQFDPRKSHRREPVKDRRESQQGGSYRNLDREAQSSRPLITSRNTLNCERRGDSSVRSKTEQKEKRPTSRQNIEDMANDLERKLSIRDARSSSLVLQQESIPSIHKERLDEIPRTASSEVQSEENAGKDKLSERVRSIESKERIASIKVELTNPTLRVKDSTPQKVNSEENAGPTDEGNEASEEEEEEEEENVDGLLFTALERKPAKRRKKVRKPKKKKPPPPVLFPRESFIPPNVNDYRKIKEKTKPKSAIDLNKNMENA